MRMTLTTALAAGLLGASALIGASAPATAGEANGAFVRLMESGADTSYAQWRGRGRGGFAGNRGFRNRGFAGRGFGGRGFGGRGFGARGFAGRGIYGGQRYGYRRRGIGAGAVIGGLAAGALVGGALAAQAAPRPVYAAPGGDATAYCTQRFKSYDPASGTYLGYDGQRHPCP